MALATPPYIAVAAVDQMSIRYPWDDWIANNDKGYDSTWVVDALAAASWRAQVVVGAGIFEWIVDRFRSLSTDPVPRQILEGTWAATVCREHLRYTEFDRHVWLGPIRGPLWCAMTWVQPMVVAGDDDRDEVDSGLAYLPKLAVQVLPEPGRFEEWLRAAIERACRFHPAIPEDPLEDLFSERVEERRGPLVAREILDPDFPYDPAMAPDLVAQMLRTLGFTKNPFLLAPPAPTP
jgi:hypothetical protein